MRSFRTDGDFRDNYRLLVGAVLPRPIAVVSTLNEDGSNNLAPFSFFTAVSARPMIVAFCPMVSSSTGRMKDTPRNVVREGEFVVNLATEGNHLGVNRASAELPYGEDEFAFAGLTPLESEVVGARRVAESPVHLECLLRDRIDYGDQPGQGQIITGEVVRAHVDEAVLRGGRIDTDALRPMGRGAGSAWIRCSDRVRVDRPAPRRPPGEGVADAPRGR